MESILKPGIGQADLNQGKYLHWQATVYHNPVSFSTLVVKFRVELKLLPPSTIQIPPENSIRFGESVGETMSNVGKGGN